MKKLLSMILVFGLVSSFSTAWASEWRMTTKSEKNVTIKVQKMLSVLGYIENSDVTGEYDAKTVLAVAEFQEHLNADELIIDITGECDSITLGYLEYEYFLSADNTDAANELASIIESQGEAGKKAVLETSILLGTLITEQKAIDSLNLAYEYKEIAVSTEDDVEFINSCQNSKKTAYDALGELEGIRSLTNMELGISNSKLISILEVKSENVSAMESEIKNHIRFLEFIQEPHHIFDVRKLKWGYSEEEIIQTEGMPDFRYDQDYEVGLFLVYNNKKAFDTDVEITMVINDIDVGLDNVMIEIDPSDKYSEEELYNLSRELFDYFSEKYEIVTSEYEKDKRTDLFKYDRSYVGIIKEGNSLTVFYSINN